MYKCSGAVDQSKDDKVEVQKFNPTTCWIFFVNIFFQKDAC